MKTLGWIIFGAGVVIFLSDFIGAGFSGGDVSAAPFLGTSGFLTGLQQYVPIPIDYGLMAAGAGILLYQKYA
ncbi:MAG TPA: hypothetical protein VGY31_03480 [Terriglobia bacterium]|nr:hypothetical protein [Terriglobia bacterium]